MPAITSFNPERWELQGRGIDPETGHECCYVRRTTLRPTPQVCTWRLVNYPGKGWRNVGQFLVHFKGFRRVPERYGVVLSGSRTDLTLLSFAESSHGNAYA